MKSRKTAISASFITAFVIIALPSISFADSPNDSTLFKSIREKLRADNAARLENVQNNEDARNRLLESTQASISNPINASAVTTAPENIPAITSSNAPEVTTIQQATVSPLQRLESVMDNLKRIRDLITSRIQKDEQAGLDLDNTKNLLSIANNDIDISSADIESLSAANIGSTTITIPFITKTKPAPKKHTRTIVMIERSQATPGLSIESVTKELIATKKALQDVVNSIASKTEASSSNEPIR